MSADAAIKMVGLSKVYRIARAHRPARYQTFQDELLALPGRLWSATRGWGDSTQTFWALRDVTFEVREGDVLGIIGRNGAGKSTLLKILARITDPTYGQAEVYGRVGSLLEVGTGFHPELTGRENVYLSGAVLGMTRREVQRKFDEIVAFAEVEKFLETPAKHYSSGMYMRLAFAVAAHLEPEILIVDEVLAVGDTAFQKKCLGKIDDVAKSGRTVLFVSHNMSALRKLCTRGLVLENGAMAHSGPIGGCVDFYLGRGANDSLPLHELRPAATSVVENLNLRLVNAAGEYAVHHPYDEPLFLEIAVTFRSAVSDLYLAVHVHDSEQQTLMFSRDFESQEALLGQRAAGLHECSVKIPGNVLGPGRYSISAHVVSTAPAQLLAAADYVCAFDITETLQHKSFNGFPRRGKLSVPLTWKVGPRAEYVAVTEAALQRRGSSS